MATRALRKTKAFRTSHFITKVEVNSTSECWLWQGTTVHNGYGRFWDGERYVYAHRYSYEAFTGPIPEGLQLDHLCRVKACVNPLHLEPVTCRENLMRGKTVAAAKAAQTHCIHGHEFDTANTYYQTNGTRRCRTCHRHAYQRWYARQKMSA